MELALSQLQKSIPTKNVGHFPKEKEAEALIFTKKNCEAGEAKKKRHT
jgi:hypothetical protein